MNSSELAIAFDVGTTTIAASLLDLSSGERTAVAVTLNPQRKYGADVVSRLEAACKDPADLKRMSALVNRELQRLAEELLEKGGGGRLRKVAFAGNPAMEHLLLGLPVESIARIPYRPLFTAGKYIRTRELGWDKDVDAYIFPLPGGFVGGDLVAFLYGIDAAPVPGPRSPIPGSRLFLDLGTNGEIALACGNGLYATSAAAGPAFEGGNLSCGMPALPGAISGTEFPDGKVRITTVDGATPVGICGSGVIEAVAGLTEAGVIDGTGYLRSPAEISSNLAVRVRDIAGSTAFVLYYDSERVIYLSQEDIRQVQMAKAAIRAGMEVLAERGGASFEALEEVVLTGSFGSRLHPGHLKNIGIFTEKMVKVARFVEEGALAGVEAAIFSGPGFESVDGLAASLKVVPLSGNPAFENHFLDFMNFAV